MKRLLAFLLAATLAAGFLSGCGTEEEPYIPTGQGLTWNAEGEVSKDPLAVVIQNGVYVTP